jgi:diadenosine tetraphosphate (Ap4A) HIT family hydrolase
MALTPEEILELKAQLREQVSHLSEPQKSSALKQIDSLSPQALEAMIKQQQSTSKGASQKGVFRSIVDGDIKSFILTENKDSIAVLDIKPISKAHTIIIPKKPLTDSKLLPNSCFSLAKKIAKKISKKLNAKSSEIQTEYKFGELIINVIPIYDKSLNLLSPRTDAKESDLQNLYDQLKIIKNPRKPKVKTAKPIQPSSTLKINRRIP